MINKKELKIIAILASIFALRMLGLCMLLPVFATEALHYTHATELLIGLAVGVYGLTQSFLQIPFGMLSDRYGRKPLIYVGLGFIVLGSVIAASTSNMYGLIIGRVLQGCGAVGSVVIALLADLVREQIRASAMAILGAGIGLAFALALVLGPLLNHWVGLAGIFATIAILAALGALLLTTIPNPIRISEHPSMTSFKASFKSMLGNKELQNLNFGTFALHASLCAIFLVLPGLVLQSGILEAKLWRVYLVALIIAMSVAWRLIKFSEKHHTTDGLLSIAILGLLIAEGLLYTVYGWPSVVACLILFFTAFCVLEASLPTLVSKYAPASNRGAALGVYACLQFFGMFIGGLCGGWLHGYFGVGAVIVFCIFMGLTWLLFRLKNSPAIEKIS